MKKITILVLALALVLGGCSGSSSVAPAPAPGSTAPAPAATPSSSAQQPQQIVKFAIGSASPGGAFYMGASALSTVINSKLDGYEATVESVGASIANIELLHTKEIVMGMSSTDAAWEAYYGKDSFEGKPYSELRCMIPGWQGVYMFITTDKTGVNSLRDFEGKAYSGAQKNSSTEILTNRIFEALGVKANVTNLPTTDAARSLADGTLAGFTIGHPAAAVTELEASHNVKIILMSDDEIKSFTDRYPQYLVLNIPANYYKALPDGGRNPGQVNLFITYDDADEELVYQVVKAAYENIDTVRTIFPEFADALKADSIPYSTIPYHKGAIRYYKEAGFAVPDELIPPEAK